MSVTELEPSPVKAVPLTPEKGLLLEAIGVLKRRGWYQGALVEPAHLATGPVCALGAIYVASRGESPFARGGGIVHLKWDIEPALGELRAIDALSKAIDCEMAIGHDVMAPWLIGSWNDGADRTVEDVVAAFRKAIES